MLDRGLLCVLVLACCKISHASGFYVSSPIPEEFKKLDVVLYNSYFKTSPYSFTTLPSLQFYYGIAPNLDIELLLDNAFYAPHSSGSINANANGVGDSLLSSTFCFLHESKYLPQLGFMPTILVPTGSYNAGLGNGRPAFYLPIGGDKTWDSWRFILNLGYTYNMAPAFLNYFYGGGRVKYAVNESLNLGAEIYYQQATAQNNSADNGYILAVGQYTLLNIGGDYRLTKNLTLLLSAGKNISGSRVLVTYLGLDYQL